MDRIVNATGMACPLPVVHAKQAADEMKTGGTLTVVVDNEIAVQNLMKFAGSRGYEVRSNKKAEKEFEVVMQVSADSQDGPQAEEEVSCAPDAVRKGLVAVLSSNTMGTGDEKLGRSLMKAFIFALSKQDKLPETILCYNGGAFLTTEGSESVGDFKNMEAEGVTILTCGTCLDFYGLKEKLEVGGVTNMYDIVSVMEGASEIIRP